MRLFCCIPFIFQVIFSIHFSLHCLCFFSLVFRPCLTLVPDNSEVDMAEIKTQTPESQKSESANKSCCTGITRRDLEVINQRLGSLEAQAKRSETVGNKTTIVGGDDRNNVGFRDKVRRKPIKTSSFNDRSSSKSRRRSPYRHTVPSDRGLYLFDLLGMYFIIFGT